MHLNSGLTTTHYPLRSISLRIAVLGCFIVFSLVMTSARMIECFSIAYCSVILAYLVSFCGNSYYSK